MTRGWISPLGVMESEKGAMMGIPDRKEHKNPRTPEEWQEAVNAAHVLLSIEAARAYGLVSGGPKVDVERCANILDMGAEHGFAPDADAVEKALGE